MKVATEGDKFTMTYTNTWATKPNGQQLVDKGKPGTSDRTGKNDQKGN